MEGNPARRHGDQATQRHGDSLLVTSSPCLWYASLRRHRHCRCFLVVCSKLDALRRPARVQRVGANCGGRLTPVTVASLLAEFQGFRISFWGNFGGVNIIAPDWMYVLLDLFTLAGLVGLAVGMWRRTLPRLLALPALWLVLIMLSLVRWTWLTMASQGRLIFPAIAAVAILIVYGLEQIRIRGALLAMVLFVFAALAPFVLIAPAYALPQRFIGNAPIFNSLTLHLIIPQNWWLLSRSH